MQFSSFAICPYLKGSNDGAQCIVTNSLIREMEGVTIKLCMHRHHESCGHYFIALQQSVFPHCFSSPDPA